MSAALLRRYISALHYIDSGRASFENAKLILRDVKEPGLKAKLNCIIDEGKQAFDLTEKRLQKILPQIDMMLSIDFDKLDITGE